MTLFRIYADHDHYLNFVFDVADLEAKLGPDYPFDADRRPKPYAAIWTAAVLIDFQYGDDTKGKAVPDIAVIGGRLYFNEVAYDRLHAIIASAGEFLPVRHRDGSGYIFNPLKTAEEVDGLDGSRTLHDEHGNLQHFAFHEDRVRDLPIFRTEMDSYLGVFCHDVFKDAVEAGALKGVLFGPDVGNRLGAAYGSVH